MATVRKSALVSAAALDVARGESGQVGQSPVIKSVLLPSFLIDAVEEAMAAYQYGARSRSVWLEEAIAGLILHDPTLLVGSSGSKAYAPDSPAGKLKQIKVHISGDLDKQSRWLVRTLRRQHPDGEGTFTDILRYAIVYRCRYPNHFPRSNPEIVSGDLIDRALAVMLDPVLAQPYPAADRADA